MKKNNQFVNWKLISNFVLLILLTAFQANKSVFADATTLTEATTAAAATNRGQQKQTTATIESKQQKQQLRLQRVQQEVNAKVNWYD